MTIEIFIKTLYRNTDFYFTTDLSYDKIFKYSAYGIILYVKKNMLFLRISIRDKKYRYFISVKFRYSGIDKQLFV